MLPSEYFRRQCWISFDPDESMLAFTAKSPLCGADRIIWASDYPHPDAKFPGVTEELTEALEALTLEQKRQITSESAGALRDRLSRRVGAMEPWELVAVRASATSSPATTPTVTPAASTRSSSCSRPTL